VLCGWSEDTTTGNRGIDASYLSMTKRVQTTGITNYEF